MKRVLTMCLAALMLLFLMPCTAKAAQSSVTIAVAADKTTLNPGDTVSFEVKLGAVTDLGGLDFMLTIPEGLSVNPDSVTMQEGLKDILKSDGAIVPPSSANNWNWAYSVGDEGYTANAELCILSFSCTVDADSAFEDKTVSLQMRQCFENGTGTEFEDIPVNLVPAVLTVEKAKVTVSGVILDRTSLTMNNGETSKLTATVEPANADNQEISWSSNNASVASVGADGTVTAVTAGTAVITVTTADGGKTASCAVTVNCIHVLIKTDAVEATCEEDGNVEYYTCSECGKRFADAQGQTEITDVTTPAKGHTVGEWFSDETSHWKQCAICGEEVDKAEHTYKWIVDTAATEDAEGSSHEECFCGEKRSENTVIPKLDHVHTDIRHHAAVEANCTEKGNMEYWTCSSEKCEGKYYGDSSCQIVLEAIETPVNPSNHIYDNDADAECNLCGNVRIVANQGTANQGTVNQGTANQGGTSQDFVNNVDDSNIVANQDTAAIAPKTGETRQMTYFIAIMIVCAFIAVGCLKIYRRKSFK